MNGLFYKCSSLQSLPDISKWNMNNVMTISLLFFGCSSLTSLPDISKWNMDNIIKISLAFFNCSSLTELPDISKWNIFTSNLDKYKLTTKEVLSTNQKISLLNKKTSSLKEIYDDRFVGNIEILNAFSKTTEEYVNNLLNEAYDLNSVFSGCSSLIEMPDISKWNIEKTKNIS